MGNFYYFTCLNFFQIHKQKKIIMRSTSALLGGPQWGKLGKVNAHVYYSLSPYEQKAFAGAVSKGIPNLARRFLEEIGFIAPPFIAGYFVYRWAKANHEFRHTKAGMIHYGEVELLKKKTDDDEC